MTPATARKPRRAPTHGRRPRSAAPRAPRRVSGPAGGKHLAVTPGGGVALPRPGAHRRGSTGVFERVRALPDHRLVDRALRGRAWIWLIGIALLGIVTMQVSLLKLNAGISRAVETSGTLERQNAELEASVARLSSGERIRGAAAKRGMVAPPAGDVAYVSVRPGRDAARAVSRMTPPSSAAQELMANDGRPTDVTAAPLAAQAPAPAADPAAAAPQPDPAATTAPVAPQPDPNAAAAQEAPATAPAPTPAPAPTETAPVAPQPDPSTAQAAPATAAPAGQGG
jgi:hypothetical protein